MRGTGSKVWDDYLRAAEQCKGVLRHAWYPSETNRKPEFGVYLANKCERCEHERVRIVNRLTGEALTPWRYIPKDKVLYKSVTANSMDEWRVRYLASLRKNVKR